MNPGNFSYTREYRYDLWVTKLSYYNKYDIVTAMKLTDDRITNNRSFTVATSCRVYELKC